MNYANFKDSLEKFQFEYEQWGEQKKTKFLNFGLLSLVVTKQAAHNQNGVQNSVYSNKNNIIYVENLSNALLAKTDRAKRDLYQDSLIFTTQKLRLDYCDLKMQMLANA